MKSDLPSLLTASSILLGIITGLYGLFFPTIKAVLDIKPRKHKVDNKRAYKESKEIVKAKYIPLLFGSIMVAVINFPEFLNQIMNTFIAVQTYGIKNTSYDILVASFIAVCCFLIFITIKIILTGIKLKKKIKELNPEE